MGGLSFARQSTRSRIMPATVAAPPPRPRTFVPAQFDPADWSKAEPLYRELLARPVGSAAELRRWLGDFSELASVMDEFGSRRYIDKSCHTDDDAITQRYFQF